MNMRLPALLTASALFLSGCNLLRTDKSHYAGTDEMLAKGNYSEAITRINAARDKAYRSKDRVVFYLDMGMLHHWNGDYKQSNEYLEMAERAIEENFTKSVSRATTSLLLNDNVLEYAGEDYEDIYLNLFKALNYLALNQDDDAFVEIRRIDNKVKLLDDKYGKMALELSNAEEAKVPFRPGKNYFQDSALGRYFGVLLYREEGKWDDVRIDLERIDQAWKLQPEVHPFAKPDFSAEQQRETNGQARLDLIAFYGRSPEKTARTFTVHTEKDLIVLASTAEDYLGKQRLDDLGAIIWPDIREGYHFKFQLPSMHKIPSRVHRVEVVISGGPTAELQPIESIENAAKETFSIKKPLIYFKTLTRAVVKGLAAERAKGKMVQDVNDDALAFLIRIFTDVATDQTENADLRISRFFPAEAAVREIHLEEGVYNLQINYYDINNALLFSDERTDVQVDKDRLNVLESAYLN
ncbi:MAG: hypothetical protein JXR40_11960 [Pontiellaceae bacterium]|nr:hypothetical protein [Pontiellaceae bacterium]